MELKKIDLKIGESSNVFLAEEIILKEGENGVKILSCEEGYKLIAHDFVKYCGNKISGEKCLKHEDVIDLLNGIIYIFRDEDQDKIEKERNTLRIDTAELEISAENLKIKLDAERLFSLIDTHLQLKEYSLKNFAKLLVINIQSWFKLDRCILFEPNDSGGWRSVFGVAPEKKYKPPYKITTQVKRKKVCFRFRKTEAEDDDISLSIIQNKVEFGFCYPFFSGKGHLLAVLYVDSTKNYSNNLYLKLKHFCVSLTPLIQNYFDEDEVFVTFDEALEDLQTIELDGKGAPHDIVI